MIEGARCTVALSGIGDRHQQDRRIHLSETKRYTFRIPKTAIELLDEMAAKIAVCGSVPNRTDALLTAIKESHSRRFKRKSRKKEAPIAPCL